MLTASVALQNKSTHDDDLRMRWTEFNLAIVLDRLGDYEASRRLWERVLFSSDRDEGLDSDLSRQTATNLAITLRRLRRYGDEFPLRVRVLESTRRAFGLNSPEIFRAEIDLAQTHRNLGNHELALDLFRHALAGLERTGGDQRTILYQKWAIATELLALKRSDEAAVMFDEVVAGATEHLEPDDPLRRSAVRQRRGYWLVGKFSGRDGAWRKPRSDDTAGVAEAARRDLSTTRTIRSEDSVALRWADEHVQAGLEPEDLDVRSAPLFPGGPTQTEADGATPTRPGAASRLAVLLVPDGTRRGDGGCVVLEGTAQRLLRPQAGEGQMEDGLSHFTSDPLPLVGPAEPGARLDRAHGVGSAPPPDPARRRGARRRRRPR